MAAAARDARRVPSAHVPPTSPSRPPARSSGVEGAIIRLSYGWGNGFDVQAKRNISECKRLGIPFGVYVFSDAESAADGASEGADVVNLLRQVK